MSMHNMHNAICILYEPYDMVYCQYSIDHMIWRFWFWVRIFYGESFNKDYNWIAPDLVWQILGFRMFIEAMSKFIRIEITYIVETLVKMFRLNFEFWATNGYFFDDLELSWSRGHLETVSTLDRIYLGSV